MKIGLLSDIHSQPEALERALEMFHRFQVDRILCAGDMVERGKPGSAAVIARLRPLPEIVCVRGNHDVWMVQYQHELRANPASDPALLLSDEDIAWLEALPAEYRDVCDGKRLYMTHASPGSLETGIYYRHPDKVKQALTGIEADIVISGHTHLALYLHVAGIHCLNPGSVWSMFHDQYATCAILTLPGLLFEVFDLLREQRISAVALLD